MSAACDAGVEINDGLVHPTPENVPAPDELAYELSTTGGPPGDQALHEFANRLSAARQTGAFGKLDGPRALVFGRISDIAVTRGGRIVVLDAMYRELREFDSKHRHVRTVGRPGDGPDEFQYPSTVALHGDRLHVLDRAGLVKTFEWTPRTGTLERITSLDFGPNEICTIDGRLYVVGPIAGDTTLVHQITSSGKPVHSIARTYRSDNPFVVRRLSDAKVGCSADTGTIVVAFERLPFLHGYSADDGTRLWTARLRDFRMLRMVEETTPDGRARFRVQAEGRYHHLLDGIVAASNGNVVVQVAERDSVTAGQRLEYAALHTYAVSATTGEGTYVGDHLPRILHLSPTALYGVNISPFPQVVVYRLPQ